MRRECIGFGFALLLGVVLCGKSVRADPPPNFQNETFIASGLTFATALEFLPDGRMLITQFAGKVLVVQAGAAVVDATPVLQLINVFPEDVTAGGERGLVQVLADPNFTSNGYFYLFYTAGTPQRDRVSRFTLVGNTASLASEMVIWQGVLDSTSTDHHGGGMVFGPDGKLYISTGDNGDPPSSPALDSDHGKLLRINSDGTVPKDNPFFDGAGPNIDAIWARGLRNPFRISLDAPTGKIYIGDVGEGTFEEVNIGAAGANFGWPVCEGPCGTSGLTNPIFSYFRGGRDGSITGGFVYRGTQFPASYQGVYFYADYAQNWIRYLTFDAQGGVIGSVNFEPEDGSLDDEAVGNPVTLKPGPEGALYYVDIDASATIHRIRYTAVNQPPEVRISANPLSGPAPLSVNFSSAGSIDPEGQPLSYLWTFGDGATSTQENPSHIYQQEGPYTVRLALSDSVNTTQSDVIVISVGNAPTGTITSPPNGRIFRAGDVIGFSGTATDLEDGTLPAGAFSWTVVFHHDTHVHPAMGPLNGVTSGTFTIPSSGHDFSGNTSYEIILTVTDSDGLQNISSVFVVPDKVDLNFNSVPPGLSLTIDGIAHAAPFIKDALVGFHYTIDAPNQPLWGNQYNFVSWADGGAQSHIITVPATTQGYTATYTVDNSPPPNQVAAFSFSEGSGTTTIDNSGSGHDASLINSPAWTVGKYGNALSFDGTNDYVSVANPSTLNFGTNDFTIGAWVKRQATGVEHNILSKTASDAWVSGGKEFFISDIGILTFGSFGIVPTVQSAGTITNDGLWHYVTATFVDSSNTLSLYIDGILNGSDILNLPADIADHVVKIGVNQPGTYFNGTLDEVRVFDRALSQSEIQSVMNLSILPGPTPTPAPTSAPSPTPTATPGVAEAINLSTRLLVGTGDSVGIGGLIITGTAPKQVLVRGIGPSLGGVGVANPLANPVLELHGNGPFATISNNDWRETQEAEITATGIAPASDFEAAILVTLDPGAYTAIVKGNGDTSGVGLVEIYALGTSASKLGNLSTRAFVRTGGDIVIAGVILGGGPGNDLVVFRGLGPSLGASGLSPVLADPILELRDSSGALVASNDNWQDDPIGTVGALGLAPSNPLESAMAATLAPGAYTALLSGVSEGTGLGLVEVYDLGSP